jgi:hypothetical protein
MSSNRLSQVNTNLKKETSSTTAAPDYLPYKVYSNLATLEQRPQEDIHPLNAAASQPESTLKQSKRHSLKLTGNVDLGMDMFKKRKQKPKKGARVENPVLNESNNDNNEEGRHHHHHHQNHHNNNNQNHPNNALPESESIPTIELLTTERIVEYTTTSTAQPTTTSSTTAAPAIIEPTTMSELKKKLEEKARRREILRAKLAQLTPEERQAFLLMKQQRAEARKKGLTFASSST